MHLVYQAYYDENGELEEQPAGHVAIWQEWDGNQLISRMYLGSDGLPMNRIDGYAKAMWGQDEKGTRIVEFYDADEKSVPLDGINLVSGAEIGEDGWSEWMVPEIDIENCVFHIGMAVLGARKIGDSYTCSFEIEFKDVTQIEGKEFRLSTQGKADGSWGNGNIWNSRLMFYNEPMGDGIYNENNTVIIDESTVTVSSFDLDFRCDNWNSGMFRIRNVKIEKGDYVTELNPGS